MVFQKDGDELLLNLAVKNNCDLDKIISAYLIAGNSLFMLLHVFEGQTLKVPSGRKLNAANLHNVFFIEDDERKFADYEKHQYLEYKGVEYQVAAPEKKILNHYYIPVIKSDILEEEDNGNNE